MPDAFSYPGLYVQELPSGVHTVVGVSTSATAFVDSFARGPLDTAVQVTSFADFERHFGGLSATSEGSYSVAQFFANGGGVAWIVRVAGAPPVTDPPTPPASPAKKQLAPTGSLTAQAFSPGTWGDAVRVAPVAITGSTTTFNLLVQEIETTAGVASVVASESYLNLSMSPADPNFAPSVVNASSTLVQLHADGTTMPTTVTPGTDGSVKTEDWTVLAGGTDGGVADAAALQGAEDKATGIHALSRIAPAVFNLMCLPRAAALDGTSYTAVLAAAQQFCVAHRAFLLVDPPSAGVETAAKMVTWINAATVRNANSAIYWPAVNIPDPLNGFRPRAVGPSGTVAGIYARTDAARGVWKAPAGVDATLGAAVPAVSVTDGENGALNPLGVNVLRTFPVFGGVVWGARTLVGADQMASQWKYVPVRRLALFIEESLFQGLRWAVFEPNDEPLWTQIRLNVDDFMAGLFRQGAFQGATARQAYMVKCDATTTTQGDIDRGIVNILVGFAPLKPAEFVVLKIQQLAGQTT